MNETACDIHNLNFEHKSHKDGTFYHLPDKFPFIYHDIDGCILITKENFDQLVKCGIFKITPSKNGDKINVKSGISRIEGYRRCSIFKICPLATFRGLKKL